MNAKTKTKTKTKTKAKAKAKAKAKTTARTKTRTKTVSRNSLGETPGDMDHNSPPTLQDTRAFRRRMKTVGRLLKQVFGMDGEETAAASIDDAYAVLSTMIIETLVKGNKTASLGEMAALSKVIAEQRSLDIKRMEAMRKLEKELSRGGDSGESLSEKDLEGAVRDLYGTNLSESSDDGSHDGD
jgi:hypothetical protein